MEIRDVESKALTTLDDARDIIVEDETSYIGAGEFIVGCKKLSGEIKAFFKPMKDAAFAAHRAVCDKENDTLRPVNDAIKVASDAALPWKREQDRLAKEEADRRYQAEAKAREDERLRQAAELEASGDVVAAEVALSQALIPPRHTKIESTVPKVAGLSTRKKWQARITDPKAVKREFCQPWEASINGRVANYFAWIRDPTPEQIAALEAEIGGVVVEQVETFAGRKNG